MSNDISVLGRLYKIWTLDDILQASFDRVGQHFEILTAGLSARQNNGDCLYQGADCEDVNPRHRSLTCVRIQGTLSDSQ